MTHSHGLKSSLFLWCPWGQNVTVLCLSLLTCKRYTGQWWLGGKLKRASVRNISSTLWARAPAKVSAWHWWGQPWVCENISTQEYMWMHIPTHSHAYTLYTHIYHNTIYIYTQWHIYTHIDTYIHTHTYAYIQTYTHVPHLHTYASTYTHIYTHICSCCFVCDSWPKIHRWPWTSDTPTSQMLRLPVPSTNICLYWTHPEDVAINGSRKVWLSISLHC